MDNLLKVVISYLDKTLIEDVEVLDFRGYSPLSDYYVIGSASNSRMLNATIENLKDEVFKAGYEVRGVEGDANSDWILLDLNDVIVNLFLNEARTYYNLDKLWSDLDRIDIKEISK